jgi:hypothetical protein
VLSLIGVGAEPSEIGPHIRPMAWQRLNDPQIISGTPQRHFKFVDAL